MGCAASAAPKKKKGIHRIKENKNNDETGSADALRRKITDIYNDCISERKQIIPYLAEKIGIISILDDERERLLSLLVKQTELNELRDPLMKHTWQRDADDIHKAFSKFSADKALIIGILATRTKWQIYCIAEILRQKYGTSLLEQVTNDMTTTLGKLITGKETGLCKLLTYRILPQAERDAAFLRDFSDGYGLDDENLIEIVCTRRNVGKQLMRF